MLLALETGEPGAPVYVPANAGLAPRPVTPARRHRAPAPAPPALSTAQRARATAPRRTSAPSAGAQRPGPDRGGDLLYFLKHGHLLASARLPAPYRKGVSWSFALAFGAMGGTVLIPYLTGRAINAVRAHDHHELIVLGDRHRRRRPGAAGAQRRCGAWSPARSRSGVELDLRNRLYGHLQRLELAFFDRQQTGQLMSRATVDLQSVRFFLGYGLIFIAQSLVTILLAAVAMFAAAARLAAISLAPVPFVVLIANRYGRALAPGACRRPSSGSPS